MEQKGEIWGLRIHHHWDLWSANAFGDNVKVGYYESDFDYMTLPDMGIVVEDTKNPSTRKAPYYRLKRRLFKAYYGFDITEVMKDAKAK